MRWSRSAFAARQSGPLLFRFLVALGVAAVASVAVIAHGGSPVAPSSDAWVYLAAGERLNVGNPLYALSPGDRPVALMPPWWSVPLLSPPPIAVVWRPLALLGEPALILWWAACVAASGWLLVRMLQVARPIELVLVIAITPFVAVNAWSGNANALLIPLLAATYSSGVGTSVAALTAVKLGPVLLLPWVFVARTPQVIVAIIAGAAIGIMSIVGAGIEAWSDWLQAVPGSAPSPQSLAGLLGIAPSVVVVACGVAAVAMAILLRDRPRASFAVACLLIVAATPALYAQGWALLAAPLAVGASRATGHRRQ